ncbi:MAG: histidine kinase, partial [Gemmatimonadaceae bacterium]
MRLNFAHKCVLVLLAWTLFGVVSSAHFFVREEAVSGNASFADMASTIVMFYWVWAVVTPLAYAIVKWSRSFGWKGWMMVALSAPLLVLLHGVLYLAASSVFGMDSYKHLSIAELRGYMLRHGGGGLATLGILLGVYLFADVQRRARERAVAAAELATRLARADLEILRWQLHPHFLFNALNTVSTLVLRGASAEAEHAIDDISRYLRSALAQRADAMVSLAEEITVVQQYVAIETLRFGAHLRLETKFSDKTLASRIPGMILQPLVENAVRYGASATENESAIVVSGETHNARLMLTVSDPGNGLSSDTEHKQADGFGLNYVRQRLRHFYGDNASLELSKSELGTMVTLNMPV